MVVEVRISLIFYYYVSKYSIFEKTFLISLGLIGTSLGRCKGHLQGFQNMYPFKWTSSPPNMGLICFYFSRCCMRLARADTCMVFFSFFFWFDGWGRGRGWKLEFIMSFVCLLWYCFCWWLMILDFSVLLVSLPNHVSAIGDNIVSC